MAILERFAWAMFAGAWCIVFLVGSDMLLGLVKVQVEFH